MSSKAYELLGGRHVAIIGAGLVGAGWAIVFARSGLSVRIYDAQEKVANSVLGMIEKQLQDLLLFGLIDEIDAILAKFSVVSTIEEAVTGAAYVQESILERVKEKRSLIKELDRLCDATTIVGSSASGLPASAFVGNLGISSRVLIVHPVNPPYLVPVVELVPSPATSSEVVAFVDSFMLSLGQSVVHVRKEIEGFVLNRLQAVLLREAWALVEEGVATCEDIDKTVRDGLGLRWSFMGPFETIDLNAPGGVADYAVRLGVLYKSIDQSRAHSQTWTNDLILKVEAQRREHLPLNQLLERRGWRDRQLMALAAARKNGKGFE